MAVPCNRKISDRDPEAGSLKLRRKEALSKKLLPFSAACHFAAHCGFYPAVSAERPRLPLPGTRPGCLPFPQHSGSLCSASAFFLLPFKESTFCLFRKPFWQNRLLQMPGRGRLVLFSAFCSRKRNHLLPEAAPRNHPNLRPKRRSSACFFKCHP